MTDPTPADECRAAAATLRDLAAKAVAAQPQPWDRMYGALLLTTPMDPAVAHWVATLGPQVAEPLAAWLDRPRSKP